MWQFEWTWTVSGVESQAGQRFKFTGNSNGADTVYSLHTSVDRDLKIFQQKLHLWVNSQVFHKLDKIGNNANIGIRFFATWKQKSPVTKCYPKWE